MLTQDGRPSDPVRFEFIDRHDSAVHTVFFDIVPAECKQWALEPGLISKQTWKIDRTLSNRYLGGITPHQPSD